MVKAGTRFTMVVTGADRDFTIVSNPFFTPIGTRVSGQIAGMLYDGRPFVTIETISVQRSQTLGQAVQGTYEYIATVTARTLIDFTTIDDVAGHIQLAFTRASGVPAIISIVKINGTTTGATTPEPPSTVLGGIEEALLTLVGGSKLLVGVVLIGAVVFIGLAIAKPGAARATARVFS